MKKTLVNLIFIVLVCTIGVAVLLYNRYVIESVKISFDIWKNNIFPSLFPFLIIGNIMINIRLPKFIGEILNPLFYNLFKINKNGAFVIILSMLSGFPSSAKYIKDLLIKNVINEKEATKLLMFTHFSNPLFILGALSLSFLNNNKIGIYILICHYLVNFFIGLIFRNYNSSKKDISKISLKKFIINLNNEINNTKLGYVISNAIKESINTLILILGSISTFLILTTLLNNIIVIPNNFKPLLNGFFEMTQGLKQLSILDINLNYKALISIAILSFGGFSVHMQIITIISDTKIKYFPYLISRLIHSFISCFIFYIWKIL